MARLPKEIQGEFRPVDRRPEWEYCEALIPDLVEPGKATAALNDLGAGKWECFAVVQVGMRYAALFKRVKL